MKEKMEKNYPKADQIQKDFCKKLWTANLHERIFIHTSASWPKKSLTSCIQ